MRFSALAVSVAALLVLPVPALSCSCEPVDPPTADDMANIARRGGLIYVGVVVSEGASSDSLYRTYTVDVEHRLGGDPEETGRVATGWGGGDCGVPLQIGTRYLFAPNTYPSLVEEAGAPHIGLCWSAWQVISSPAFISQVLGMTAVTSQTWSAMKIHLRHARTQAGN